MLLLLLLLLCLLLLLFLLVMFLLVLELLEVVTSLLLGLGHQLVLLDFSHPHSDLVFADTECHIDQELELLAAMCPVKHPFDQLINVVSYHLKLGKDFDFFIIGIVFIFPLLCFEVQQSVIIHLKQALTVFD